MNNKQIYKVHFILVVIFALTLNAMGATTFDEFKLIPDRNVFNTLRLTSPPESLPTVTRRERVVETFSLLGTMKYDQGHVAFFEGSNVSFKKSVKVDESIAGCKITAINADSVTIEANGKPLELKVGFMLRREDDGAWEPRVAEREFSSLTVDFSKTSSNQKNNRRGE